MILDGIVDDLIVLFGKKITVYDCPCCKADIEYGTEKCPQCKSNLSWNMTTEYFLKHHYKK